MRFHHDLDELFANRSAVRILRALDGLPMGFAASGRELGRRAGVSHPTATATLERLAEIGIVEVDRARKSAAYTFNEVHFFAPLLRSAFASEHSALQALILFLQRELQEFGTPVETAHLFGSVVRGDSNARSDIDLAVTCRQRDLDNVATDMEVIGENVAGRFGNRLSVLLRSSEKPRRGGVWGRVEAEGVAVLDRRSHA